MVRMEMGELTKHCFIPMLVFKGWGFFPQSHQVVGTCSVAAKEDVGGVLEEKNCW